MADGRLAGANGVWPVPDGRVPETFHDSETRFRVIARSGDRQRAMAVLDRLDALDRAGAR